jgi:hypothetical protein
VITTEGAEPQESNVASAGLERRSGEAPLGYSRRTALRREQCNVDGQSIVRQRLSKHVITQATIEVWVFAARCWVLKQ